MNHIALLVRSVLRWSCDTISEHELRNEVHKGPKKPGSPLGHLMVRADFQTSVAIAKEIAEIEKVEQTDEYLDQLISCIRANWGEPARKSTRRTGTEDSVLIASRIVTAVKQFSPVSYSQILDTCGRYKKWTLCAEALRGRDVISLKQDFNKVANMFYQKEAHLICSTAEYIYQLSKR